MGCGNAKEAFVVHPPNAADRQLAKQAIEERRKLERERKEKKDAAKKAANDATYEAINEIVSKLGTLESYWTAGEFESENLKPHFIPILGPMSLSEKVPAAPPSVRGIVLFASIHTSTPTLRRQSTSRLTTKKRSGVGSSIVAEANIAAQQRRPQRSQLMPLPRHIRPMFVDEALLHQLQRNKNAGGVAHILGIGSGNNNNSYSVAGMDTSVALTHRTVVESVSIAETPIRPTAGPAVTSPVHVHLPPPIPDDLLTPRPALEVLGLNITLLSNANSIQRAYTGTMSLPYYQQHVPRLTETCFMYPNQPFVGRAYMGCPLGNLAAGWVRLPCGPVTRKKVTRSIEEAGDHASDRDDEPTSSSPVDNAGGGHQHGNNRGAYYFAPEVKGFINAQKPNYDVKEDGPVGEPIGSHAYEAGGGEDGDDMIHDDRQEQQQPPPAVEGEEGAEEAKVPTIGAVRHIVPRRLEKYYLYPKELTALGIKVEYRQVPSITTVGDAATHNHLLGTAQLGRANTLAATFESSPSLGPKHASIVSVSGVPNSPRRQLSGVEVVAGADDPLCDDSGMAIEQIGCVGLDLEEVRVIAHHNIPVAYCCPQPISLTSFYQSACEYFGEDRPNGLAVKVMRREGLSEVEEASASPPRPPSAQAAGCGLAAANSIADERPLDGCFVTFFNPNASTNAKKTCPPTPADQQRHSKLFSSSSISEENSIPLYLFSDPTTEHSWWPAAHRYAVTVAKLQVERDNWAKGDALQRVESEKAIVALVATETAAKEELMGLQRRGLLFATEDEILWMQFRKELSAFLARVLEQNIQAPTIEVAGTPRNKVGSAGPSGTVDQEASPSPPRSAPTVQGTPQSLSETTRPRSREAEATSDKDPSSHPADESFAIPSVVAETPAENVHSLPDFVPKNAPAIGLQIRFTVQAQYNNTRFVAFNAHGRNNVAEATDCASSDSTNLPQWFTFSDSTRRPRTKPFAKPLAEGAATMVFPKCITARDAGVATESGVDSIIHLKYVCGVLAVLLDEFTASIVN